MATVKQLGFFESDAAEPVFVSDDLATSRGKILARLRKGPASNDDLVAIAKRFGARLQELRDSGVSIETKYGGRRGLYFYHIKPQ